MVPSVPKVLSRKTIHLHVFYMHLIVGATCGSRDAYYFSGTPGLTFTKKRSTLPKEMHTTIYTSSGLMILNADNTEAFPSRMAGAVRTFMSYLIRVCPYLCSLWSFMLSLSLPIICVVFPSGAWGYVSHYSMCAACIYIFISYSKYI